MQRAARLARAFLGLDMHQLVIYEMVDTLFDGIRAHTRVTLEGLVSDASEASVSIADEQQCDV